MRRPWRTTATSGPASPLPATTPLLRDVSLICVADGIVAVSFGAISVAGGLPWWVPVAMSLLVFAGGAQFAATSVVLAGGSPVAAVAAGALQHPPGPLRVHRRKHHQPQLVDPPGRGA